MKTPNDGVEGVQHLPDPDSDPPEVEPQPEVLETVEVTCAGCHRVYKFDIKPSTATFTFICKGCGTRAEWARVE